METPAFFTFLFIHLTALILGFGAVLVTDLFGLLWVLNRVRFPQLMRISAKTEKFIWAGWLLLVLAGICLAYIKGVIDNLMIIKLYFVILIAINGIFLHILHDRLRKYSTGEQIPNLTMFHLVLALTVSQISWWGAVIIGFAHRHMQTVIMWPASPWLACLGISAAILLIWFCGELFFRDKKK